MFDDIFKAIESMSKSLNNQEYIINKTVRNQNFLIALRIVEMSLKYNVTIKEIFDKLKEVGKQFSGDESDADNKETK